MPLNAGALWPGIGAVAAFALVVMQDEEKAFWTLAGLANRLFSHCDGQVGCCLGLLVAFQLTSNLFALTRICTTRTSLLLSFLRC